MGFIPFPNWIVVIRDICLLINKYPLPLHIYITTVDKPLSMILHNKLHDPH